ncbi:hypothetical protein V6N13_091351 [Hibiscus sabdariffa]
MVQETIFVASLLQAKEASNGKSKEEDNTLKCLVPTKTLGKHNQKGSEESNTDTSRFDGNGHDLSVLDMHGLNNFGSPIMDQIGIADDLQEGAMRCVVCLPFPMDH